MIRDYWIEEIKKIKEFEVIGAIEDNELTTVSSAITQLIDDQFIQSATEKGIVRREKLLNITPYADDTLESRRFRISSRWDSSDLTTRLNQLCGENGYTMTIEHDSYSLTIRVELTVSRMEAEVMDISRKMAPANMRVTVELRYMQHKRLFGYTHNQLKAYSHKQLREQEEL